MRSGNQVSWGYQDLLIFVFLSLIAVIGCQLFISVLAHVLHADSKSAAVLLPSQVLLYICLFAVLFAIIKLQYGRFFWESLGWKQASVGPGAAFLIGLALAFAVAILAKFLHLPDTDTPIKKLLSNRSTMVWFAILGTTLGPLCEELVFRGFIQPVLVRSLGSAVGIILTASFFGVLHLAQNAFLWQAGLLIAVAGIAFGWMRELTGSTKASTWMHAGYNSTFFLTLFAQQHQ